MDMQFTENPGSKYFNDTDALSYFLVHCYKVKQFWLNLLKFCLLIAKYNICKQRLFEENKIDYY